MSSNPEALPVDYGKEKKRMKNKLSKLESNFFPGYFTSIFLNKLAKLTWRKKKKNEKTLLDALYKIFFNSLKFFICVRFI